MSGPTMTVNALTPEQLRRVVLAKAPLSKSHSHAKISSDALMEWYNGVVQSGSGPLTKQWKDVSDGLSLVVALEVLTGRGLTRYNHQPRFITQKIDNVEICLQFLREFVGNKIEPFSSRTIANNDERQILALVMMLYNHQGKFGNSLVQSPRSVSPKPTRLAPPVPSRTRRPSLSSNSLMASLPKPEPFDEISGAPAVDDLMSEEDKERLNPLKLNPSDAITEEQQIEKTGLEYLRQEGGDVIKIMKVQAIIRGFIRRSKMLNMRRQAIVSCLFESQKTYLEGLDIIVEGYMPKLKPEPEALSTTDYDTIFKTIVDIRRTAREISQKVESRVKTWSVKSLIGDIFLELSDQLKSINNYSDAHAALDNYVGKSPKMVMTMTDIGMKYPEAQDLYTLLVSPTRRIYHYQGFINDLLSTTHPMHPDRKNLEKAAENLSELVRHLTVMRREEVDKKVMNNIAGCILGNYSNLITQNRAYVMKGAFHRLTEEGKNPIFLVLFSDILVLADPCDTEKCEKEIQCRENRPIEQLSMRFQYVTAIKLNQIVVETEGDAAKQTTDGNVFHIHSAQEKFSLECPSTTDLLAWVIKIEETAAYTMATQVKATVSRATSEDPSTREIMRGRTVEEISTTEKTFLGKMKLMNAMWIRPLKGNGLLPLDDMHSIYDDLASLVPLHEKICKDLNDRYSNWNSQSTIGDVFLKYIPDMEVYRRIIPCTGEIQHQIDRQTTQSIAFADFSSTTSRASHEGVSGEALSSLIIMPFQRITRYKMLLERVASNTTKGHPDEVDLKKCVKMLSDFITDINRLQRAADEVAAKKDAISQIIESDITNGLKEKVFVHCGYITHINEQYLPRARYAFLFEDIMILTKRLTNVGKRTISTFLESPNVFGTLKKLSHMANTMQELSAQYQYQEHFELNPLSKLTDVGMGTGSHRFTLHTNSSKIVFECPQTATARVWMRHVEKAIDGTSTKYFGVTAVPRSVSLRTYSGAVAQNIAEKSWVDRWAVISNGVLYLCRVPERGVDLTVLLYNRQAKLLEDEDARKNIFSLETADGQDIKLSVPADHLLYEWLHTFREVSRITCDQQRTGALHTARSFDKRKVSSLQLPPLKP
ncbi:hypothetical protein PROFUN_04075 [Planoprotostelium fungivorum]|uniref:DH domain-containing protein n=1 Tax=Planoprotostelium fungivorum TaxID=1890364 RepID=A0A2P6NJG5_9EUKA|nr:hypothetical protein PROFUN_04075 [Planoprotostelium fungivorum]